MRTILAVIFGLLIWAGVEIIFLPPAWSQKFVPYLAVFIIGFGVSRDRLARQKRINRRFKEKMFDMYERVIYLNKIDAAHDEHVSRSSGPPFGRRDSAQCIVLFLRPFVFDNQLRVRNPQIDESRARHFIPYYSTIVGNSTTLDAALAFAVRDYGELVAIGEQTGNMGATRFETNELDWRRHFAVLVDSASVIVVCTSQHAGTAWEVEQICSSTNLLKKSVFLLPPGVVDEEMRGANLKGAARLLRRSGCQVPRDANEGECFAFDSEKMPILRKRVIIPDDAQYYKLDTAALRQVIEVVGV